MTSFTLDKYLIEVLSFLGGVNGGGNVVDGFHIHIQNRMMKPPAIALSGAWRGLQGERWWGRSNQCTMMKGYLELSP
jgi:hypothetical protein